MGEPISGAHATTNELGELVHTYEWFSNAISEIRTPKFFQTHAPTLAVATRRGIKDHSILPNSYRTFVAEYATCLLFRDGNSYLLRISEIPWYPEGNDTQVSDYICFGGFDQYDAYFSFNQLKASGCSAVYEGITTRDAQVAATDFNTWLRRRFESAKLSYSLDEWAQITSGPRPFSRREQKIVEARRHFKWRIVRKSEAGYEFEIQNNSDVVLPYLSLRVRARDSSFEGGIWLPVSSIRPGQSAIVRHPGYSDTKLTRDVEFTSLPDPQPEDRDEYWEFRTSGR